jgi:hypothetical protein
MRVLVSVMTAGALLATGALAAPGARAGRDGDKQQPVGAAARAKHGPEPLAAPPSDVGMAEDPAPANGQAATPPPVTPPKPKG